MAETTAAPPRELQFCERRTLADLVEEARFKMGSAKRNLTLSVFVVASCILSVSAAPPEHNPSELIGTWKGTSTCTDRVAAPACHDEVVIYDFTAGEKKGVVRWQADKVVNGERQPMGEMDLVYDTGDQCWSATFTSPRGRSIWCLVVDGAHLTGTGKLLPGKETVRKIDVRKE